MELEVHWSTIDWRWWFALGLVTHTCFSYWVSGKLCKTQYVRSFKGEAADIVHLLTCLAPVATIFLIPVLVFYWFIEWTGRLSGNTSVKLVDRDPQPLVTTLMLLSSIGTIVILIIIPMAFAEKL